MVGVRHGNDFEIVNPGEVRRVAGVQRDCVGDGGGGDKGVIRSSNWFPARASKGCGDAPESARGRRVKGNRLEIGFGLLKVGLARRPITFRSGDVWTNRQLGQGDGADDGLFGQERSIRQASEEDHRRRVEQTL